MGRTGCARAKINANGGKWGVWCIPFERGIAFYEVVKKSLIFGMTSRGKELEKN